MAFAIQLISSGDPIRNGDAVMALGGRDAAVAFVTYSGHGYTVPTGDMTDYDTRLDTRLDDPTYYTA